MRDIIVGPGGLDRSSIHHSADGVMDWGGVVIGAGSVVANDCDPNCLYAGVPAKKIKELT